MVSGPYRPEKPKTPDRVGPTYNAVLQREAPRAEQEQVRSQFEAALRRSPNSSTLGDSRSNNAPQSSSLDRLAVARDTNSWTNNRAFSAVDRPAPSTTAPPSSPPVSKQYQGGQNAASQHAASTGAQKTTASGTTSEANAQQGRTLRQNIDISSEQNVQRTHATAKGTKTDTAVQREQASRAESESVVDGPSSVDATASDCNSEFSSKPVRSKTALSEEKSDAAMESVASAIALSVLNGGSSAPSAVVHTSAYNAHSFDNIDKMLHHLSAMDARSAPREWRFQIENSDSPLVNISVSTGKQGGWVISVSAHADAKQAAQACLGELTQKLDLIEGKVESLELKEESDR